MEEEDKREAVAESGMEGFVMPDFHAEKSSETAAKECDGEETCFRDAPFVVAGFPFVDTIEEKSNDIHHREVKQNGEEFVHQGLFTSLDICRKG